MTILRWVVLGAALVCGGCGDDGAAVDEHRQAWLANHPEDYVVEICGTGFAGGCTLSAVSGGEVIAARSGFGSGTFKDVAPASEEPIAALFERAAHEARSDECDLNSLSFDSTYSFVSNYYCDYGEEGSGEKVQCFEPDTTDLLACPE